MAPVGIVFIKDLEGGDDAIFYGLLPRSRKSRNSGPFGLRKLFLKAEIKVHFVLYIYLSTLVH